MVSSHSLTAESKAPRPRHGVTDHPEQERPVRSDIREGPYDQMPGRTRDIRHLHHRRAEYLSRRDIRRIEFAPGSPREHRVIHAAKIREMSSVHLALIRLRADDRHDKKNDAPDERAHRLRCEGVRVSTDAADYSRWG